MDLNRGKIVEEWKISDNVPIKSYAPSSKFAQLTNQQTLTGISSNGLFEIDPRLRGTKLVNDQTYKQYKTTNNQFQTLATTESGHIALGSGKGDIRLFDRLGVNAKTALPTLGDPIVGIDVSKDGRWILATCKTYILLIDTKISAGQKMRVNQVSQPISIKIRNQLQEGYISYLNMKLSLTMPITRKNYNFQEPTSIQD